MNIEELRRLRDAVKEQHDNLSNPNWVAAELHHLRGKYDQLVELVTKEEESQNATSTENGQTNSNNDQGSEAV